MAKITGTIDKIGLLYKPNKVALMGDLIWFMVVLVSWFYFVTRDAN